MSSLLNSVNMTKCENAVLTCNSLDSQGYQGNAHSVLMPAYGSLIRIQNKSQTDKLEVDYESSP